jgi:hypothetical protein
MKRHFEVWMEGYLATGMEGVPAPAQRLGSADAETFAGACLIVCAGMESFDTNRMAIWGCRLFDNEAQAREFYG